VGGGWWRKRERMISMMIVSIRWESSDLRALAVPEKLEGYEWNHNRQMKFSTWLLHSPAMHERTQVHSSWICLKGGFKQKEESKSNEKVIIWWYRMHTHRDDTRISVNQKKERKR
jgi:hypothetical protein